MIYRVVALVAVVWSAAALDAAAAGYGPAQRAVIRSMPITQRPNRPGHFYGNTVRALNRIGF